MAQKIFAVHVNSMAEERTVSNFTWITPTCRARLSVASMTRMTQIRQFYKTERSSSKPPHVPRLKYAKAAEKMRRQQLDEFSTFQPTETDDSDNESDANLNPGGQTYKRTHLSKPWRNLLLISIASYFPKSSPPNLSRRILRTMTNLKNHLLVLLP